MLMLTLGFAKMMALGTQLLEDEDSGEFQWMLFIGPLVLSIGYQTLDGIDPD